jgi:DNA mismatch repair protein MutL
MPIIKLSQDIASKIAAGEVVERPVSVIKELIENAIDADATEITVAVEEAGRRLIEVTDNGFGIGRDEIALAAERYATSKIQNAEDLNRIQTLGFRGEALASIAAVSRFSIESKVPDAAVGYAYWIEGGQVKDHKEIGKSSGTRVAVRDLFFNVPARLKFLKADRTERQHINQVVSRYALYYSSIRFSLIQDGKNVIATNGNGDRVEILSQLMGLEIAKQMLPVNHTDDYITISGYTSPYNLTRASRTEIFFFINGRLVSDATITSAITRGYHGLIMVGRFPTSILFLDLDPEELDVNVHPTKTEIRLKDKSRVFTAVQRIIRKTISAYSPVPAVPPAVWSSFEDSTISKEGIQIETFLDERFNDTDQTRREGIAGVETGAAENLPLLRLIGQLGQTYLAAEGPDGLYLIDQHAAHERVLFEQLSKSISKDETQLLLEPAVITVNSIDVEMIKHHVQIAQELGFKIEDFGPQSLKIIGVPLVLSKYDPQKVFTELFSEEDEQESNLVENEKLEVLIRQICKKIAVKGGQRLSIQEQELLIRDLERCENPRTCPHGRPTIIHISVDALERRFGRTGSI